MSVMPRVALSVLTTLDHERDHKFTGREYLTSQLILPMVWNSLAGNGKVGSQYRPAIAFTDPS